MGVVATTLPGTVPAAATATGSYVHHLDWLRGVAIVQVVLLHSGNALLQQGLTHRTLVSDAALTANHILFHNATVYFCVISGILYAHLFRHRPHGAFFKARLLNVGLPYVVVSCVLTVLLWLAGLRHANSAADLAELTSAIVENVLMGSAWNTLWYIPVVLGLYAISPLLLRIADDRRRRWAAALLLAAPLLVSRTGTDLSVQIFVYFMGTYMFGLIVGARLDAALAAFGRYWTALVATAIAASAILVLLYATDTDWVAGTSLRESAYYVQRLAMTALFILVLSRWRVRNDSRAQHWVEMAAATSFGVYFVHGPVLRLAARIVGPAVPQGQPVWALLIGIAATFVIGAALSLAVVLLVRRIAGRKSRMIIGS